MQARRAGCSVLTHHQGIGEPGALATHAGIRAGGGRPKLSLVRCSRSRERRIVALVSALEIDRGFPKSLTAGHRRARGGRWRTSGALLVPMLLKRRMWL
jgi:hypothetical protein